METGHVLVGLGYDDEGRHELDWAAREALTHNLPLRVLRAHDPTDVPEAWIPSTDSMLSADARAAAQHALDTAFAHLRQYWPEVRVAGAPVEDDPARALIAGSANATVTVVGGRQLSALGAAVLGSVSTAVVAGAIGPVVVVGRHALDARGRRAVVVGVDGSAATDDTLAFAFDYATRHGRPLDAIYCHPSRHVEPERGADWVTGLVAAWRDKYPHVDVTASVVAGRPIDALVTAAAGADLLVVGPRARRRRPALLGSVSQGVLHHAHCPVAVVHAKEAR